MKIMWVENKGGIRSLFEKPESQWIAFPYETGDDREVTKLPVLVKMLNIDLPSN